MCQKRRCEVHAQSLVLGVLVREALPRGRKLAQLVTHHLFGDGDGHVLLAVVDQHAEAV